MVSLMAIESVVERYQAKLREECNRPSLSLGVAATPEGRFIIHAVDMDNVLSSGHVNAFYYKLHKELVATKPRSPGLTTSVQAAWFVDELEKAAEFFKQQLERDPAEVRQELASTWPQPGGLV